MIWGDGTTYEGSWRNGFRDGFGKLVTKKCEQIGMYEKNRFIKDQSFVFDGVQTGHYGEFKQKDLKTGALGVSNLKMRRAILQK